MKVKFGNLPSTVKISGDIDLNGSMSLFGERRMVLRHEKFVAYSAGFLPAVAHLRWNQAQELEIRITLKYDVLYISSAPMESKSGSGRCDLAQRWRIAYGDNGIQLLTGNMQDFGSSGEGDFAIQIQLGADQSPSESDHTFVSLLVRLLGGYTDEGITVGYGPASIGMMKSQARVSKDFEFRVECHAKDRPEKKQPTNGPLYLLNHPVVFEQENQPQLSAQELRRLADLWAKPLQKEAPELASAIELGLCPITLIGHASTTGGRTQNLALSAKRITSVMVAIRTNFNNGQRIVFVSVPKGSEAATQRGPIVNEHRVEIRIDPNAAAAAISAVRSKGRP